MASPRVRGHWPPPGPRTPESSTHTRTDSHARTHSDASTLSSPDYQWSGGVTPIAETPPAARREVLLVRAPISWSLNGLCTARIGRCQPRASHPPFRPCVARSAGTSTHGSAGKTQCQLGLTIWRIIFRPPPKFHTSACALPLACICSLPPAPHTCSLLLLFSGSLTLAAWVQRQLTERVRSSPALPLRRGTPAASPPPPPAEEEEESLDAAKEACHEFR